MRRSKNRRNCGRKPIFTIWLLRGNTMTISTMSTTVSTLTRWNAQRQPNTFATHMPTGTPTTDAMEKPENTHAMNFVRYRSVVTSGAYVMAMATSVPETSAMRIRAMTSTP